MYRSSSRKTSAPLPAPLAMLADERDDMPLGGYAGELAAPSAPAPQPPAPLVIEPPDWERELAEREDVELPAPPASVFGEWDPPPLVLEPPEVVAPLTRPVLPEPDWRAEEEERSRQEAREKAAATLDELEPEQPPYPAKKKTKTATPNLDAVRAWRQA